MRELWHWHKVIGTAVSLSLAGGASAQASKRPVEGTGDPVAAVPPASVSRNAVPSLTAEVGALVPGETVHLLVSFEIKPHWHMYWNGQNDTGLAPTWKPVDWPAGYELGAAGWPGPRRLVLDGGIRDHIYEGRLGVVLELRVPPTATPGTSVTLPLHLEWMVCERLCVLEEQDVSVTLPIVQSKAGRNPVPGGRVLEEARKQIPRGAALAADPISRAQVSAVGDRLVIRVAGAEEIEFYPSTASPEPGDPIAGTTAKGEELSVAFAGPSQVGTASGVVASRKPGQASWDYDWVDMSRAAREGQAKGEPAQIAPAR